MSAVTAQLTGEGKFQVRAQAGGHELLVDEPAEVGGLGTGPNPFDLLCTALASCTLMTMKLYAERKSWTLGNISIRVTHEKASADKRDRFDRVIELGDVADEQREGLLKIAQRCPVDLLLERGADVTVTTTESALASSEPDCSHAEEVDELCRKAP